MKAQIQQCHTMEKWKRTKSCFMHQTVKEEGEEWISSIALLRMEISFKNQETSKGLTLQIMNCHPIGTVKTRPCTSVVLGMMDLVDMIFLSPTITLLLKRLKI